MHPWIARYYRQLQLLLRLPKHAQDLDLSVKHSSMNLLEAENAYARLLWHTRLLKFVAVD
jgi:hypothetical protein